jgi:hypothetical protein
MTRKIIIALAISAIACTAWTSNALAAKHKRKIAAPPATQAETIQGVNPMSNAPQTPAVAHPGGIDHMPGANPM